MTHTMTREDLPRGPRATTRASVVDRLRLMRELCRVVSDCEKLTTRRDRVMAQTYLGELAAEIERTLRDLRRAA